MGGPRIKIYDSTDDEHFTPISSKTDERHLLILTQKLNALNIKFDMIRNFSEKHEDSENIPIVENEIHLESCEEIRQKLNNLLEESAPFYSNKKFVPFQESCEKFSDEFYSIFGELKSYAKGRESQEKSLLSPKPMSNFGSVFVPKIPEPKIPEFDGSKSKWLEFRETFKTLIHNNGAIPQVVKLTYLLDKLKGKAKDSLGFVSFNAESYEQAWQTLCSEYDDRRSIIDVHVKGLLELPRVSKDNVQELTTLVNLCNSYVTSLSAIDYKVDKLSEMLIINIILGKLNPTLKMEWEKEVTNNEVPNYNQFMDFLRKQCRILQRAVPEIKRPAISNVVQQKSFSKSRTANTPHSSTFLSNHTEKPKVGNSSQQTSSKSNLSPDACPLCPNENHFLYACTKFHNLDTKSRFEKVKEWKLCINCLRSKTHLVKGCTSHGCRTCGNKHHTMLHFYQEKTLNQPAEKPNSCPKSSTVVSHETPSTSAGTSGQNFHVQSQPLSKQIILSTAIVLIRNAFGRYIECRTLLDNASTSNYITDAFADRLKLSRYSNPSSTMGINNIKTKIAEKVYGHVQSRTSSFQSDFEFNVVSTISNALPQSSFNISRWNIPNNLTLADPQFYTSRPVDMLIGGERFFDLITSGKIALKPHLPHFQNSVFGWICVGSLTEECHLNFALINETQNKENDELQQSLKRLFDIDHVPDRKFLSKEEQFCEDHFAKTVSRDQTGRYIVSLPLKENAKDLGDSKTQALKRFASLERKFDHNPEFKKEYSKVITDYIEQNHMNLVDDSKNEVAYYLPHHAVIKLSSSTTKVRVVFDASSKTTTNLSLNDVMAVGPTIQQTCFDIILRFRKHRYVFTSDISQMYRQVKIFSDQTPLQRIVWRNEPSNPIQIFELNRVTFGTAAAPFLATRALKQLAIDEAAEFPLAADIVHRDFYVDDVLSGSDNLDVAIELQSQLKTLLEHGGFKLHKWSANNDKLLEQIPINDRETLKGNQSSEDECLKTLGLIWLPKSDVFQFNVPEIDTTRPISKRTILSDIAKLYDILGLLAPSVITAKLIVQELWKCNLDWDDPIPTPISDKWNTYRIDLSKIANIKLDRRILMDKPKVVQLHGFSDASEKAYGACLYIRTLDENFNITVRLLCSKTRVAPMKTISLPRLELCAAYLLSRLVTAVLSTIEIEFDTVYLWSDSTITLSWIQTPPHRLKTFVANRVNEIQESTINHTWNHVETMSNPADIISRGVMPSDLTNLDMWWSGPNFLHTRDIEFKSNIASFTLSESQSDEFESEIKKDTVCMTNISERQVIDIERYSSFNRLVRSIAYVLRYLKHLRTKAPPMVGEFTVDELNLALLDIVRNVQKSSFQKEIHCLTQKQQLSRKSPILSLNPFVDSNGILRVGGRLRNSNLDYDAKHQILLPSNCHFTTLVFRHYHQQNLHAGPSLLVSLVRKKFWPLSAKVAARKTVRSCIPCFKVKPQILNQIMGDLPTDRTSSSSPFPFRVTGIDLCGPFLIKNKKQRASSAQKMYIAVFVCFATKCIHLEVLSDLTAKCFIDCLKRFVARRGIPSVIWSDNATNFVGARNQLQYWRELFQKENELNEVKRYFVSNEITWNFIPPRSPNFGGLWESAVKSLKYHLKRIGSESYMSPEELNTLVIQVEGLLNSRPLTPLSTDPNDPEPLTPAHFLIGRPIVAITEPDYTDIPSNRLENWDKVSKILQHFWDRYSVEYCHTLQKRVKWQTDQPNLEVNDIVIIADEKLPTSQWMLGIVLEIFRGKDNKNRVALIKTKVGNFKRAVSKLSKLPLEQIK